MAEPDSAPEASEAQPTTLVGESTSAINDVAETYTKHGGDALWNGVAVVVLLLVLTGGAWLIRHLLNKDRLHSKDALDWVRANHPDALRPDAESIDFLEHPYFTAIANHLATVKNRQIPGRDGHPSSVLLAIHCDVSRTYLRHFREQTRSVLKEAMTFKGGLDVFFGTRERFECIALGLLDHIDRASEHELLFKHQLPEASCHHLRLALDGLFDSMGDTIRQAARSDTNLERLNAILNGLAIHLSIFGNHLALILQTMAGELDELDDYNRPKTKGTFTMDIQSGSMAPPPPGNFSARELLNKQMAANV